MSYTVLARKFRSQNFDEVVGQAPIVATLKNAIEQNRVHHGYLFCGTRGVGKTSMARILAKALNCHAFEGPTVKPCGACDSCVGISRGDDVDVVEIDAASNTGVDNIRELRSNAVYRPARSRFKVYIIDEVHMLSMGAFNALLKTLEEPPSHVKFIFATTETQKVPATILSRVQRFDFKSIPPDEIEGQIHSICKSEHVEIDAAAAKRLARLANGSMRDALSLLDQVLSMAGNRITTAIVDELLPAAHDELNAALIDALAANDAAEALAVIDRSLGGGATLDLWCSLLINQLRDLMVLRVAGEETDLVDVPSGLRSRLVEQSRKFDGGAYVFMITVLEELRRSVKSSGSGRALVEAAIIRLAEASNYSSIESLLGAIGQGTSSRGSAAASTRAATAPAQAIKPAPRVAASEKKNEIADERTAGSSPTSTGLESDAPAKRRPLTPGSRIIASGEPIARSDDRRDEEVRGLQQPVPPIEPAAVRAPSPAPESATIAHRTTQEDIRAAQNDPLVREVLDLFGGQIVDVRRNRQATTEGLESPGEADEDDVAS
ncbi:MAG: DNA polymerase III subunit gamma/tau [Phycisphaerae bacterium]|nr:DNA polymerase III subunit gamma/tau [Phycisphaerae bacterium]